MENLKNPDHKNQEDSKHNSPKDFKKKKKENLNQENIIKDLNNNNL